MGYDSAGRIVEHARMLDSDVNRGPLPDIIAGRVVGQGGSGSHYVDVSGPAILQKSQVNYVVSKVQIVADSIDSTVISGLLVNTIVTWPDGLETEVNDGQIEFSVDLAGTHTFIIDAVPHLKQEIQIEAIAPA
jgi:hypothetical protein